MTCGPRPVFSSACSLVLVCAAPHVLLLTIRPATNPALKAEHQACLQACFQEGYALLMLAEKRPPPEWSFQDIMVLPFWC